MKTKELTLTAIMTAFVFIATFVPKIPIPLGYANLGNAAIFVAVYFLGRRVGIISGAIGAALADLIGGFPIWIVPTLLIKAAEAEIFYRLQGKNIVLASSVAILMIPLGYTIFGAILYASVEAGISQTPGLCLEAVVNVIAAVILISALKTKFK